MPFQGFEGTKKQTLGQSFPQRDASAKFTFAHDTSAEAVRIGREAIIGAAVAFGLAQEVTNAEGKKAYRLTANSPDELVSQFNSVAGSPATVYVTAKKSDTLKADGTPFINNDVSRISAL